MERDRAAGRGVRRDPGTPSPGRGDGGRYPELDALRGLAALAVVIFHANPRWMGTGWAAVDFFFVLSGFLITSIILKHGGSPGFLRAFYVRRGLRVWPIYFLALAAVIVVNPVVSEDRVRWGALPAFLTFTQNIELHLTPHSEFLTYNVLHTWTLAIEEQFYLVWPAFLALVGGRRRRVAGVAIGVAALSVALRCRGLNHTVLLGRADGLALGGLLAVLLERPAGDATANARRAARFGLLGLLGMAGVVAVRKIAGPGPEVAIPAWPGPALALYNVAFLGAIGLVVCQSGRPWLAPLRVGPLMALGRLSYGLYLYHYILIAWSVRFGLWAGFGSATAWRLFGALPMGLLAAWCSWRWVEEPALRWKDRFPYRREPSNHPPHHVHAPSAGRVGPAETRP
jgi:peptidoglycan/LPS O-acetylase OafA/YrhL